jgi:monofunctional biosynthetic peptidoglycan transglycosylase
VGRSASVAQRAATLVGPRGPRRILGLYRSVVALVDGVFGVEAGARHRFGTSASAVGPAQAVVLASMLPAPRRADLSRPSARLAGRSRRLLDRMRDAGRLSADEHLRASAELERVLVGAAGAPQNGEAGTSAQAVTSPREQEPDHSSGTQE